MSIDPVSPRSLDEAITCLRSRPGLQPLAGCTDVLVPGWRGDVHATPMMDLLRIPVLRGVSVFPESIAIGATTTFCDLRRHEEVRRCLPSLADAAGVVGGWQIQTRATVGGNIANASPAGDSLPVWLALDAVVVVVGPDGPRRIRYGEMHLGYRRTALRSGEIIQRIDVPRPRAATTFWFRKVGARRALAIAKVVVAGAMTTADGVIVHSRVAAGSVAPIPIRLTDVEQFLLGRSPSVELADEAGRLATAGVQPVDDLRSTASYRAHVLGRLVRRWVLDAAARDRG